MNPSVLIDKGRLRALRRDSKQLGRCKFPISGFLHHQDSCIRSQAPATLYGNDGCISTWERVS